MHFSLTLYLERQAFRCRKTSCNTEISVKKNSFFALSKLACSKILLLGWLWLNKVPTTSICSMAGHSTATIVSFAHFYRQLVTSALDTEPCMIGGEGIVVEIDEAKFGKRKYHRGHHVEGAWIVGGIERTDEKKAFLERIEDRRAETLLEVIGRFVLPGSIVYTDMWKGYAKINETLNLTHCTVNHSENFKDPITGVHTNTIEGLWNGIKFGIKARSRNKKHIDEHLMEFIWRKRKSKNLWEALLSALSEMHYD
jgi:transposase-like protein